MKLVLVRHGQSEYNLLNIFTGWLDPHLSEKGVAEAQMAGQLLKEKGIQFDIVHTSFLTRAIQTTFYILQATDQLYLPVYKSWRLNERHYGALQGLNKAETAKKYGEEQVHIWRRSYSTKPPILEGQLIDPRYHGMDIARFVLGESLEDTLKRVLPYWQDQIAKDLKEGKNVLVSAHGNSLRSLIKFLESISDEAIPDFELATGVPIVYELDDDLKIISKEVLS